MLINTSPVGVGDGSSDVVVDVAVATNDAQAGTSSHTESRLPEPTQRDVVVVDTQELPSGVLIVADCVRVGKSVIDSGVSPVMVAVIVTGPVSLVAVLSVVVLELSSVVVVLELSPVVVVAVVLADRLHTPPS